MMAGKHISVTHIAGSVTKFMGNGAQHAIATAAAAALCLKYETTPSKLRGTHFDEMRQAISDLTNQSQQQPNTSPPNDRP
jgi:hypothetical protein